MGWVTKTKNYVLKYIFIKILATFQGTPHLLAYELRVFFPMSRSLREDNVQIIEET